MDDDGMTTSLITPGDVARALFTGDRCAQSHGIECRAIDEGYSLMAMTVREDMANTLGICHGGMIFTLADTALAYAASADNQASVTTSATISYPAAARTGDLLVAECRVVHQAGKAGIYDVEVRNEQNVLVAVFRGNVLRTGAQIV
ncbi:hydroxyphenylacetyl-CoA thioesterase PaaI [Nocardia farcinica]